MHHAVELAELRQLAKKLSVIGLRAIDDALKFGAAEAGRAERQGRASARTAIARCVSRLQFVRHFMPAARRRLAGGVLRRSAGTGAYSVLADREFAGPQRVSTRESRRPVRYPG